MVHCCGDSVIFTKKTVLKRICFEQPDATIMRSSHIVLLPIPQLSLVDHRIHVIPSMKDRCLMSVGKLCDDGSAVNFDARHVYLKSRLILIGNIDHMSGLYYIEFYTPNQTPNFGNPTALSLATLTAPIEAVSYSVHHMTTKSYLVQCLL